jgi:CRP-like cAMP-binding protein
VTHQTLAQMVGTTRPRVSLFMSRFRKLGLIEYKKRELYVNNALLDFVSRG